MPGPPARAATPSSCTPPPTARCSTTPPPVPRRCGTRTACTRSTAAGAAVLEAYGEPDRILCAEAWVTPAHRLARYVRPDEMHQAFNFDFLDAHWDATALQHRHRGEPAVQRRRRRPHDVGAVEPRRRAARVAPRARPDPAAPQRHPRHRPAAGCRARPAAGARRHGPHAGAARRRLRLPGRGARAARAHRPARLGPPGPDVPPHPREGHRPRRLPGADAVGQGRARATGSARATSRGCPSPTPTPTSRSTSRRASRARPSSSTARCSTTVAGTGPGTAASPGTR